MTTPDLHLLIATAEAASRFRARSRAKATETEVADPDRPRGNPNGLPDGRPIERLMVRAFRRMERETTAWMAGLSEIPTAEQVPTFRGLLAPTAEALATLTLAYRLESGRAILEALGADPDGWEPDREANASRAEFAVESILETIRSALAVALVAGGEPESKGLREFARSAWDRIRGVFRRAIDGTPGAGLGVDEDAISRARMIAETEASVAIHEAAVEAGAFAGATLEKVFAKAWRLDGRPCPICIANRDAGTVGLDDLFPSGQSSPPSHPNCRCSLVIVELQP